MKTTRKRLRFTFTWHAPQVRVSHLSHTGVKGVHWSESRITRVHFGMPAEMLMQDHILPLLKRENLTAEDLLERLSHLPMLGAEDIRRAHQETHDAHQPVVLLNHQTGEYTVVPWVRMGVPYPGSIPTNMDYSQLGVRFWKELGATAALEVVDHLLDLHERDDTVRRRVKVWLKGQQGVRSRRVHRPLWLYQSAQNTLSVKLALNDKVLWIDPMKLPVGVVLTCLTPTGPQEIPLKGPLGLVKTAQLVWQVGSTPGNQLDLEDGLYALTEFGHGVLLDLLDALKK